MTAVLLLARVALAAVFAVAGAAKLADRAGARDALAGFGVRAGLVAPLAIALPLIELAVAAALLPAATAPYAAVAAFALLALFALAIARALRAGRAPDCRCFGRLHSAPAGRGTLLRNGLLAALAAAVALDGLTAAGGAPAFGELALSGRAAAALGAGVVLALAAAALVWFGWELLRQNGRLLERIDRLEAATGAAPGALVAGDTAALAHGSFGSAARGGAFAGPAHGGACGEAALAATVPDLALADLDGTAVPLAALGDDGRPVLLVFSDPSCGPCRALLPEIAAWERALDATVALVSGDDAAADARAHAQEHGIERLLLDPGDAVSDALRVAGTPSAVLLDGGLAAPPAAGAEAIRELVASLGAPAEQTRPLADPLLPLRHVAGHAQDDRAGHAPGGGADLPGRARLAREIVVPTDATARDTLLLFWNPTCGFCEQMLGELRALDRRAAAGEGPRLVVVSSGGGEENAALGLTAARVVDDDSFALGRAFGAAGTPSAVLLDPGGRVAAPVAVGSEAVLALAGPLPAAPR